MTVEFSQTPAQDCPQATIRKKRKFSIRWITFLAALFIAIGLLYATYTTFIEKDYYLLKFDQSVRGLSIGAAVEFKGFPVGNVADIGIEYDLNSGSFLIPVKIEIERERLMELASGTKRTDTDSILKFLVQQGLRGQLRTGSLLSSRLYIALDFFKNAKPARVVTSNGLLQLPTVRTQSEEFNTNLENLLKKLQKFPAEKVGSSAVEALQSIKKTSDKIRKIPMEEIGSSTVEALQSIKKTSDKFQKLPTEEIGSSTIETLQSIKNASKKLEKLAGSEDVRLVFKNTQKAIKDANAVFAKDSATFVEIQRTLRELSEAAKAIRSLADQLERHPESLLRGKGNR